MDKNFVNIDDLVRQRLNGAEERERSGAWLRMRELLDKEEPQKPIGFLYWRRIFGAVAVLLLLTSITVGGYKMSSSMKGNNQPGETALASADVNASTLAAIPATIGHTAHNAMPANSDPTQNVVSASENSPAVNSPVGERPIAVAGKNKNNPHNKPEGSETQTTKTTSNSESGKNVTVNGDEKNSLTASNNTKKAAVHKASLTNAKNDSKSVASSDNKKNETDKVNGVEHSKSVTDQHENQHKIADATKKAGKPAGHHNILASNNDISSGTANAKLLAANTSAEHSSTGTHETHTSKAKLSAANTDSNHKSASKAVNQLNLSSNSSDISSKTPADSKSLAAKSATEHKSASHTVAKASQPHKKNTVRGAASATPEKNSEGTIAAKTKETSKNAKTSGDNARLASATASNKNSGSKPRASKATMAGLALSSHSDNKTAAAIAHKGPAAKKTPVNATKLATVGKGAHSMIAKSSHSSAKATNLTGTAAITNKAPKSPALRQAASGAKKSQDGIASANPGHKDGANGIHQNKVAGPNVSGDNGDADGSADNASSKPVAKRDNVVLQKMKIVYRTMRTAAGKNYYEIDTNSIMEVEVTKQFTLASEPEPTAPSTSRTASNTTTNNAGANQPFIGPPLPPNYAAAKSNSKSALASKVAEKGSIKEMGDGALTGKEQVEKLNEAFNDIKYKVGATKFAPGLTAGINGTFFGPNSFKGFQFGFAGDFIFGDTWSVMCELEYFHRINNNNYSIADEYYSNKQINTSVYSFSTLHSFELPISARYNVGNFSFCAGVNLEYSLSISPDSNQSQRAVTMQPAGTSTTPKIGFNDFASRFGVGYLVGAAYRMSSNVTLDIRNVQNVWDNSKSSGGKIVSDQLYKSPSLQLSIIYRFGGKKGKE